MKNTQSQTNIHPVERWAQRSAVFFLILLVVVAFDYSVFLGKVRNFESANIHSEKNNVELLVVLTGGAGRVGVALNLLEKGLGSKLLVSGTDPQVELSELLNVNNEESWSPKLKSKVILGKSSSNTKENAEEIVSYLQSHQVGSVLLISHSFHLPRSLLLLEKELKRVSLDQSVKVSTYSLKNPSQSGRLLFFEYLKYFVVRLS